VTATWSRQKTLVVSAVVGAACTLAVVPVGRLLSGVAPGAVDEAGLLVIAALPVVGGVIAAIVAPRSAGYAGVVLGAAGGAAVYALWYSATHPAGPYDGLAWVVIAMVVPLLVTIGWLPAALLARLLRR
jgi:hypothetical protein